MQFRILRNAAAMRPTVRAAKACWPKQLQRINYASLAKTKAHIRAHMARISVSHTHTHRCTCVYLSVIFCHFYLHKQQSCRAKLLHSLAAFIVRPAERRLGQRNMQMPHKCSSSNSPNASAVPRPLCNVALSAALRHFTSHFACARV